MPWPDPIVAPTARVRGSQLARYTCVGEESVLEESVLGDYSYVMERCFLQNAFRTLRLRGCPCLPWSP